MIHPFPNVRRIGRVQESDSHLLAGIDQRVSNDFNSSRVSPRHREHSKNLQSGGSIRLSRRPIELFCNWFLRRALAREASNKQWRPKVDRLIAQIMPRHSVVLLVDEKNRGVPSSPMFLFEFTINLLNGVFKTVGLSLGHWRKWLDA